MNETPATPFVPPAPASQDGRLSQRITIVDLQIPFGRMVAFMVKWAFAAIPALIIVWMVCFAIVAVIVLFLRA